MIVRDGSEQTIKVTLGERPENSVAQHAPVTCPSGPTGPDGQVNRVLEPAMAMEPEELEEEVPPRGHVKVVYTGPVAPHWEIHRVFGDRARDRRVPPAGHGPTAAASRSTTRSSVATVNAWPEMPNAST